MTTAHHALTAQASDAAVDTACRMLRLPTMRAQAADTIGRAEREGLSYAGFLAELLMAECEDRDRRRAERRIRAAHFPRDKSLREFDYSVNPHVDPAVVNNLCLSSAASTMRPQGASHHPCCPADFCAFHHLRRPDECGSPFRRAHVLGFGCREVTVVLDSPDEFIVGVVDVREHHTEPELLALLDQLVPVDEERLHLAILDLVAT
ncbi:ATP-binding protein [Streptomyces sp. NBC_01537]|uniref:ATP-binding protein n=1 Tax=Streptomyces sp. NBC_01537 TaxID=2903896 RepID=UPI00386CF464